VKLVLADVDAAALDEVAEFIGQSTEDALAVPTDVTNPEAVENLADTAVEKFGAVHLFCNNAGIGGAFAWTWDQPLETWERVLRVNLLGVIYGIRTFVPRMLRQDTECHIINTASVSGMITVPFLAPYHATKHAVVALSESLHYELAMLGAKVKVSVFCPGFVRTPIVNAMESRRWGSSPLASEPEAWHQAWHELLSLATPPSEVVPSVIEAIRNDQFYIFPSPDLALLAQPRMEAMLNQQNPELTLPPEITSVIEKYRTAATRPSAF
jgi:NAD(P)-dependent dehydrogenase (short-subunit alcohol dehydrogenase family)